MNWILIFSFLLIPIKSALCFENDTTQIHYKRLAITGVGSALISGLALHQSAKIWDEDQHSDFHFKDDWSGDGLVQTDEVSHMYVAYKIAQTAYHILRWDGFSDRDASLIGTGVSFLILFIVEYPIDSYNAYQGFGKSDLLFNSMGASFMYLRNRYPSLKCLDLRISNREPPWEWNRLIAQTRQEYDTWIYWLTYSPFPDKIPVSLSLGYSSYRTEINEPKRIWHLAFTTSFYELYSFVKKSRNKGDYWGGYQFPIVEHQFKEK